MSKSPRRGEGFDSVSFSAQVEKFGTGSGMVREGLVKLGESVTMWMNPAYGYVTFRGSLPKHFSGSNVDALPLSSLGKACEAIVHEAQDDGWIVPAGDPPWSGTLRRVDVTFDLASEPVPAIAAAYEGLRFPQGQEPWMFGRPAHGLSTVRTRNRRVLHRAYDKGLEAGVEGLEQLRLEVPLSSYRCEKAGAKRIDGAAESLAAEAWSMLSKYGWWEVL